MKQKSKQKKQSTRMVLSGVAILVLLLVGYAVISRMNSGTNDSASQVTESSAVSAKTEIQTEGDLVIPISEVSETAKFYAYDVDGTKVEVLAIKAPDGSIRTAFNTCQVCYNSGKGYYVQEGDTLVCQNCGNRFQASEVEVSINGCNPVPITDEYKTVTDSNITISRDFLKEATVIFEKWKS